VDTGDNRGEVDIHVGDMETGEDRGETKMFEMIGMIFDPDQGVHTYMYMYMYMYCTCTLYITHVLYNVYT